MPDVPLSRLGVFTARGFLAATTCAAICEEMIGAAGEPGWINTRAGQVVDPSAKKLKRMDVSAPLQAAVDQRISGVRPDLERFFGVTLTGSECAMFYRYGAGDYFKVHRDVGYPGEDHPRQVSLVLYLNDPSGSIGPSYEGGTLILYDLFGDGLGKGEFGVKIEPAAGLLVAFRSRLRHEVTPITAGTRCVAVDRFY